MYESILVATDGSDPANRALDLASRFDARLYGLSVVDTSRYGDSLLSGSQDIVDELEGHAESILAEVETRANVDVTTAIRRGRPHEAIGEYAAAVDADLIVIGNRGLDSGGEIGSTAERVVRYVDQPVLTV